MIGVYDSGVGGLSVWKELYALMPDRSYLYVADSAHCPYGGKSPEYIRQRAGIIVDFMIGKGVEAVVVACNTATAAAISYLRSTYDIPFVGMEPAVKPATLASKTGVVGVLATANTFKGSLYRNTVLRYASSVHIVEKVGQGLVEAVEKGVVPTELIKKYVGDMLKEGADTIVLGCTHYPFLSEYIAEVAGPQVKIINPAPAVALQTMRVLEDRHSTPPLVPELSFYSTGDVEVLYMIAKTVEPSLPRGIFHELNC